MRLALEGVLSGKRPPTAPLAIEGTRTVPAGPVDAVLGSMQMAAPPGMNGGSMRSPAADTPAPRTERGPLAMTPYAAAPSPGGYGPPPAAPPMTGAHAATGPSAPRRRRRSGAWALVVIPLLVGAGVVAALIAGYGPGGETPQPTVTPTPTATATATSTAKGGTAPAPTDSIAPLVTAPHPQGTVRPPPVVATDGGKKGPPGPGPAPSDTVFPPVIPSTLPFPFPEVPDGGLLLPFPIPSTLPSTLPFPIPGIPGLGPAPTAAPSSTPKGSSTL
jgi:hypothetical protein